MNAAFFLIIKWFVVALVHVVVLVNYFETFPSFSLYGLLRVTGFQALACVLFADFFSIATDDARRKWPFLWWLAAMFAPRPAFACAFLIKITGRFDDKLPYKYDEALMAVVMMYALLATVWRAMQ